MLSSTTNAEDSAAPCLISDKCQQQVAKRNLLPGREELGCDNLALESGYFRCICAKTRFLGHNDYFSAHCVLNECKDERKKRAFIKQYKEGCKQIGETLADIPAEWAPFAKPPPASSSSSTHAHPSTKRSSTGLVGATTSTAIVSSAVSELSGLDTPTASTTDVSTSLTQSSAEESSLTLSSPFSSSTASFPVAITPAAEAQLPAPRNASSTGIIAGSVVATALVLVVLVALAKLYWDARKKAARLRVVNAELQDAMNPDGVSRRISDLRSGLDTASVALRCSNLSCPGNAESAAYVSASGYDGGTVVDSPVTRAVACLYAVEEQKHDVPDSGYYAGYSGEYGVFDELSNDQGANAVRRISIVSESDYGSVQSCTWDGLVTAAAGGQEIRPLQVRQDSTWREGERRHGYG